MTKQLSDYTAAELRAWAAQNKEALDENPAAKATYDEALIDAIVRERIAKHSEEAEKDRRAKELDARAEKMWPELKDKDSPIAKKVRSILENDPKKLEDPEAVYHAANQAGLELGLQPAGSQPKGRHNPHDGIGAGEPSGPEGSSKKTFTQKNAELTEAFRELLGKDPDAALKRIDEKMGEQSDG